MQTIYSGLENPAPLAWKVVGGPSIAPANPDGFNVERVASGALKLTMIGSNYAGELASLELPLPPNNGHFSLAAVLEADDACAFASEANELDLIASLLGWHYNASTQVRTADGMFQIVGANGDWVNTGILAPLVAGQKSQRTVQVFCDWAAHTVSVLSLTVDGLLHMVPATLQIVPATEMGWADGLTLQAQGDCVQAAGAFSWELSEIEATAA